VTALEAIWKAAGYPWSVRLKALLPGWLPWAQKRLHLTRALEQQLLAMSPRQMDRRLKERKKLLGKRIYGRTKPGSLLKHHIPLKIDRWEVNRPGFTEIDLVSHSGNCASGEFIHTLNVTDIHSTWVESCALMGRSQIATQKGLEEIRMRLPFSLLGIDSDNGSEFINNHLAGYCQDHNIQFTRGRPYKKDDNAHIEQKNWTHVRRIMGYERYDTSQELEVMNRLYSHELRVLQNLFLPSVKLLRKERVGSRVRRRYDAAQTPLQRLAGQAGVDAKMVAKLEALRQRVDPFTLSQSIDRQLELLYGLTRGRSVVKKTPRANATPWTRSYKAMWAPSPR
jgi:hypothetical protein